MKGLQAQQSLEEEAKNIDFPIPIKTKGVTDLFCYLSEKIPCTIHYKISTTGVVDMSNVPRNSESPSEITGKIFERNYLLFSVSFSLPKTQIPPFFTGIKFNIYPRDPNQIEFMKIIREHAKRYFLQKKTSKT